MDVYAKMKELGAKLPAPPALGGAYRPVKEALPGLYCASGCGPALEGQQYKLGKLGAELSVEDGREAARRCALNLLANIEAEIGDLNRVSSIDKVLGFVASAPDFYEQPKVIDGASELFRGLFGEGAGVAARSAIGVSALPGNIPVEIELMFSVRQEG
jgi:enamine deaminase RidA (YjgF/YER057c/UK114 family)